MIVAQDLTEYGALDAIRQLAYSIASWLRSDRQTAWMIVIGLVVLWFLLRRRRRF